MKLFKRLYKVCPDCEGIEVKAYDSGKYGLMTKDCDCENGYRPVYVEEIVKEDNSVSTSLSFSVSRFLD